MKLAYISDGFHMWSLYVAHDRGFFQRAGVDVQPVLTRASGKQLAGLIAGDYQVGFQQSDHVVRAVEQGADLFVFMAVANQPDLGFVVAPGIRDFAGLRGQVVAVDGPRSGYALLQKRLLAEKGLGERDYTLIEAGGVEARYQALKDGKAVAAWLNPPFEQWLLDAGYRSLGRIADFFPGYPGVIAAARRSWARANEAQLVAFIRAYDDAYAWVLDERNEAEARRIAVERLKTSPQLTAAAYRAFVAKPRPAVTPAGLREVIDAVWEAERFTRPRAAPEKYLDPSYAARA